MDDISQCSGIILRLSREDLDNRGDAVAKVTTHTAACGWLGSVHAHVTLWLGLYWLGLHQCGSGLGARTRRDKVCKGTRGLE